MNENAKYIIKKIFTSWITKLVLTCILGVFLVLIFGFVTYKDEGNNRWCNSCFVTFFIIFGLGAFSLLNNFGTFDLLGYSFSNLFSVIIHKDEKKYVDAIDYRNKRKDIRYSNRFTYFVYFGVSLVFLITAIILLFTQVKVAA